MLLFYFNDPDFNANPFIFIIIQTNIAGDINYEPLLKDVSGDINQECG